MKAIASPQFRKKIKKLSSQDRKILDDQVRYILSNPSTGEEKIQDLQGVLVHKFKMNRQQVLLSYKVVEKSIYLITFGSHENYYRDLKKYLN